MDRYGTVIEPNTVHFERLLPGPLERMRACLTGSEKRAKWLASGAMDLHIGGDVELFRLHANLDTAKPDGPPQKYKNGHTMKAKITRYGPPHVLGYS